VIVIARLALAGVLVWSAGAKLAAPASSRAALATYSISDARAQAVGWVVLVAVELALAAGVIAGSATAAYLAAAMLTLFALMLVGAILRGRAGAPCPCLGADSVVGWPGVVRDLALAGGFAALPLLA
jgi:hypothetical protein